jgi:hypothetical protein
MYVDSGFANWKPEMQSWCGYIGVFYGNLLFFASLLQPEQALSTGQAEFTAASMGCRPLLAFANLYMEIERTRSLAARTLTYPIPVYIDSTAAQCMMSAPAISPAMKHVALAVQWVKTLEGTKKIHFLRIASALNLSDIMTKASPKSKRGIPTLRFLLSHLVYMGVEAITKLKAVYERLQPELESEMTRLSGVVTQ